MKVIFMGTPKFAKIILSKLIQSRHKVVALVCQPDKPNKRGNKIEICDSKKFAIDNNIPVFQYPKIVGEAVEELGSLDADVIVTASFGQLLREEVINLCPKGIVNVHSSLLPEYRGASPIAQAIFDGKTQTGVTIMKTTIGMDDGDIYKSQAIDIDPDEDCGNLSERLAIIGGELLIDVLDNLENGITTRTKQDENSASYCKKITKDQARIDWSKSAPQIHNMVRAYNPSPVAFFVHKSRNIKVYKTQLQDKLYNGSIGTVLESNPKKGLVIGTGKGSIRILTAQAPNGKILDIKDFLNGYKINVGETLD